jgi:hypothetical protein
MATISASLLLLKLLILALSLNDICYCGEANGNDIL